MLRCAETGVKSISFHFNSAKKRLSSIFRLTVFLVLSGFLARLSFLGNRTVQG